MFAGIERARLDLANQRRGLRAEGGKVGLDQLRGEGLPFREAEASGHTADDFLELMTEQIVQGGRRVRSQADSPYGGQNGLGQWPRRLRPPVQGGRGGLRKRPGISPTGMAAIGGRAVR